MGRARYFLNEILCCLACAKFSSGSRTYARRTPASLVSPSPKQTDKRVRIWRQILRIQTTSPLNHSPTSRRSLMAPLVSPRQTMLCHSGLAQKLLSHSRSFSHHRELGQHTNARGDQMLLLQG
ncbi:hypothetical protein ARMGADRAFT_104154 [Armillaria gallica]|uniref:Uncharacterized protein n=1 Tax=Armillaria gallica TaxID=47427 RepID=A0A2H3C9E2_ARMGA|nr:hypothetical protein ARMGADRAFT_104154 [Armillaria gallica]